MLVKPQEWDIAKLIRQEFCDILQMGLSDSDKKNAIAELNAKYHNAIYVDSQDQLIIKRHAMNTSFEYFEHSFLMLKVDSSYVLYAMSRKHELGYVGEGGSARVKLLQDEEGYESEYVVRISPANRATLDHDAPALALMRVLALPLRIGSIVRTRGYFTKWIGDGYKRIDHKYYEVVPRAHGITLDQLSDSLKIAPETILTQCDFTMERIFAIRMLAGSPYKPITFNLLDKMINGSELLGQILDEKEKEIVDDYITALAEQNTSGQNDIVFTDEDKLRLAMSLAKLIQQIHDASFLHLDIKGSNFFGAIIGGNAVITPIDLETVIRLEDVHKIKVRIGTPKYEPPRRKGSETGRSSEPTSPR